MNKLDIQVAAHYGAGEVNTVNELVSSSPNNMTIFRSDIDILNELSC